MSWLEIRLQLKHFRIEKYLKFLCRLKNIEKYSQLIFQVAKKQVEKLLKFLEKW